MIRFYHKGDKNKHYFSKTDLRGNQYETAHTAIISRNVSLNSDSTSKSNNHTPFHGIACNTLFDMRILQKGGTDSGLSNGQVPHFVFSAERNYH